MINFVLLFSRQGKLRLQKWYTASETPSSSSGGQQSSAQLIPRKRIIREVIATVLARKPKMCNFVIWKDLKVVYKRYASLFFCCAIDQDDNEILMLEIIHRYVELLDKYFGSVCELDIIFNYEKAYFVWDEFVLAGELQEMSKRVVLKAVTDQDVIQEEETPQGFFDDHGLG